MSDVIARGLAAERLLSDETMNEVWSAVLHDMMTQWAKTPEDQADKREALYRNVVAVDRVRGLLRTFVQDGKMASEKARRDAQ